MAYANAQARQMMRFQKGEDMSEALMSTCSSSFSQSKDAHEKIKVIKDDHQVLRSQRIGLNFCLLHGWRTLFSIIFRAVKPCGFSPGDRRRVPFKEAWVAG
jgi:hypothetical protein